MSRLWWPALLHGVGKALHCLWWACMLTSALPSDLCNSPEGSQEGHRVPVPPQTLCWWKPSPSASSTTPSSCEFVCLSQTQTHSQTKQTKHSHDRRTRATQSFRSDSEESGLDILGSPMKTCLYFVKRSTTWMYFTGILYDRVRQSSRQLWSGREGMYGFCVFAQKYSRHVFTPLYSDMLNHIVQSISKVDLCAFIVFVNAAVLWKRGRFVGAYFWTKATMKIQGQNIRLGMNLG